MRVGLRLLLGLAPVLLSGCADTPSGGKSYLEHIRGYSTALTRSEREKAIQELEVEKTRQELLKKDTGT